MEKTPPRKFTLPRLASSIIALTILLILAEKGYRQGLHAAFEGSMLVLISVIGTLSLWTSLQEQKNNKIIDTPIKKGSTLIRRTRAEYFNVEKDFSLQEARKQFGYTLQHERRANHPHEFTDWLLKEQFVSEMPPDPRHSHYTGYRSYDITITHFYDD